MSDPANPFPLFRFRVEFRRQDGTAVTLSHGAFAECTGLEATMEPKVIKAGGANYGAFQRAGRVSFATVILKRGITENRDLWKWFSYVNERGKAAFRMDVTISVFDRTPPETGGGTPQLRIKLLRALPVKFRSGDLNGRATDVGIEELHLAHEGLVFM
jgi:phage tail-like protein